MKRVFIVILFTIVASLGYAQNPDLAVEGSVVEMTTDLDARAYFPKRDINDRLCALIKVTLTNTLRNPLTLEVGGLGVVAREEKENGEIWFYVPAQVRNLSFKCAGYIAPAPIPVVFKEGTVYGITLSPGAVVETVTNAVLSTNYLKLRVDVTNVTISLGRTKEYELLTQSIEENEFAERLDYGTYYYAIRHPLYETYEGRVELNGSTPKQEVSLKPAFGYLDITSTPEGATIYMDGQKLGTTPYSIEEPMPKGKVNVRAELAEYYSSPMDVNIVGDGSRQKVNITLKPRFADVTMVCPDGEAEIWIDNQLMGVGSWSGHLRSTSRHLVETRRAGHRSQSTQISVKDGERVTHTLNAPVPLYGSVDVNTSPLGCTIKIDGEVVGESPYIGRLLVGKHEVELSKYGYRTVTLPVEVTHNQVASINETLKKGGTLTEVMVSCADKEAEIYMNDKPIGKGEWHGSVYEGEYTFEARKAGYQSNIKKEYISGSLRRNISLMAPRRVYGTLTAEGTRLAMVSIYSFATGESTEYNLGQLRELRMPIGEYEAYAYKEDHHDSPKQKFTILANQDTKLGFYLEEIERESRRVEEEPIAPEPKVEPTIEPAVEPESEPEIEYENYNSKFVTELTYDGAYVGGNVGMFFGKRFGLYGSFAMGLTDIGPELSVGPMFRIGNFAGIDTQVFAGIGFNQFMSDAKIDAGVRIGYDILKGVGGKTCISFGATYVAPGRIYPKIGIGILWGRGK